MLLSELHGDYDGVENSPVDWASDTAQADKIMARRKNPPGQKLDVAYWTSNDTRKYFTVYFVYSRSRKTVEVNRSPSLPMPYDRLLKLTDTYLKAKRYSELLELFKKLRLAS